MEIEFWKIILKNINCEVRFFVLFFIKLNLGYFWRFFGMC